MKAISTFLALVLVCAACYPTAGASGVAVGKPAPAFSLKDADGKTHSLADFKGKYVVLEWVNYECPFVKKHYDTANMQKLQKEFTAKGVVWLSINSSAPGKQGHFPPERINALMKEKGAAPTAYLIDSDGTVGKLYGAKTTPHMYIIDPQGNLIYMGAIDDKPSTEKADVETARNYVRAALEEALSGKPVSVVTTQPYGCSVKY
ncbi:MAG: thioredoxin family protein [Acidobacteriota bacterium]|nr:thioredoxin family protein [Blastocatellia bacterium]MDW8413193.1 thioredoxin family protein [Acidobacteriota bacterium]